MNGPFRTFRLLWDLAWLRARRGRQLVQGDDRAVFRDLVVAIGSLILFVVQYNLARAMFLAVAVDPNAIGMLTSAPEGVLAALLALSGGLGLVLGVFRANDVLFMRSDLDWMMGLPLNRRGIVLARAAETALGTIGPVVITSAPAMSAYAVQYGAWHALALYPLFLIALSALTSATAILVSILVGRLATTTRAREAIELVGSLLFAALYMLSMFRSPAGSAGLVDTAARGLAAALRSPAAVFAAALAAPVAWPALGLYFIANGPVSAGVLVVLVGLSGTAGVVWLLSIAGAGAYARGLGLSSARRRRATRAAAGRTAARSMSVGAGVLPALMRRDWAILTRSPRLWQPIAMPLAWAVYVLISRPRFLDASDFLMPAFAAAAAAMVAGTLSMMSFGVEGSSFYHVSTLPLSPHSRVVSKVLVFALPPTVMGLVFAGVFVLRGTGTVADLLRAAVLVVTAAVTITAVGVMMTVGDTNFDAVNPRLRQTAESGCLSTLLIGVLLVSAYLVLKASQHIGLRLGLTAGAADACGIVLVAAVCLGGLVPAAVRNAAAAVRARGRGESVQASLSLNW